MMQTAGGADLLFIVCWSRLIELIVYSLHPDKSADIYKQLFPLLVQSVTYHKQFWPCDNDNDTHRASYGALCVNVRRCASTCERNVLKRLSSPSQIITSGNNYKNLKNEFPNVPFLTSWPFLKTLATKVRFPPGVSISIVLLIFFSKPEEKLIISTFSKT